MGFEPMIQMYTYFQDKHFRPLSHASVIIIYFQVSIELIKQKKVYLKKHKIIFCKK